jgi:hypothetical protein
VRAGGGSHRGRQVRESISSLPQTESTTSSARRWWLIASTPPEGEAAEARHARILRIGALVLTLLATASVLLRQDRITVQGGAGWDGADYLTMAETGDARLGGRFHGLRIGVPFLARHFLFDDLLLNFEAINLICGVLFSLAAFALVASVVQRPTLLTIVTGWALLTLNHLSPLTLAVWQPVQIDSASNLLSILLIILILTQRLTVSLAFALALGGTLVRENFAVFLVFLLAVRPFGRMLATVVAGGLGSAAGLAMIGYAVGGNPLFGKGGLFLEMVQVGRFVPEVTALVFTYGSALLFLVLTRASQLQPVPRRDPRAQGLLDLGFMAPFTLALAWGAGGNAERYLFWAYPILVMGVVPHIEALIRARRFVVWSFGVLFLLIFQHTFVPIGPSGTAGCDLVSAVLGRGTFVGHWTMLCSADEAFNVLVFYAAVCATGIALAYGASVIAGEGEPQMNTENHREEWRPRP